MIGKVGDNVLINSFNLAGMPIHDPSFCFLNGVIFKNSLMSPYGEVCKVRIIDYKNEISKQNFDGTKALNEDVTIDMTTPFTNKNIQRNFKIAKHELDDSSSVNMGNIKYKQHIFTLVRKERIEAESSRVNFSSTEPITDQMKKILEENFKAQVDVRNRTTGGTRHISTGAPLDALNNLINRAVGPSEKDNCFFCFAPNDPNKPWVITSMNHLINNSQSVFTYKQSTTLAAGASQDEIYGSLINFKAQLFDTPIVARNQSTDVDTYNLTTGRTAVQNKKAESDFPVKNSELITSYNSENLEGNKPRLSVPQDPVNNKPPGIKGLSNAKQNRNSEYAQYLQDCGEMTCHYNPDLEPGAGITLDLPDKSNDPSTSGETQFNGNGIVLETINYLYPTGIKPGAITRCKIINGGKFRG